MKNLKQTIGYFKKLKIEISLLITFSIGLFVFAGDVKDGTCTGDCIIDEGARYIEEGIQRVESGVLLYEEGVEIFSGTILK